jgi:hypothetical protein
MFQFINRQIPVLLGLIFIGLFSFDARSTHILGGEVYYDSLGNGFYKVTFEIYRDCNSATAYDNPWFIRFFMGMVPISTNLLWTYTQVQFFP